MWLDPNSYGVGHLWQIFPGNYGNCFRVGTKRWLRLLNHRLVCCIIELLILSTPSTKLLKSRQKEKENLVLCILFNWREPYSFLDMEAAIASGFFRNSIGRTGKISRINFQAMYVWVFEYKLFEIYLSRNVFSRSTCYHYNETNVSADSIYQRVLSFSFHVSVTASGSIIGGYCRHLLLLFLAAGHDSICVTVKQKTCTAVRLKSIVPLYIPSPPLHLSYLSFRSTACFGFSKCAGTQYNKRTDDAITPRVLNCQVTGLGFCHITVSISLYIPHSYI